VWLVRGITPKNIKDDGGIKSGAFITEELSVTILSLDSIKTLLGRPAGFHTLAACRAGYCRELGLQVERRPEQSDPDHVVILLGALRTAQRIKAGKRLRDAAEEARVLVEGSAEEVYGRLRARCDELNSCESSSC
jgi:hypothetical protein